MDKAKQNRLEAAGWRGGTAEDFLGLSPEEAAFVEVTLALRDTPRARRTRQGLSQAERARRLGSSQSRVARLEAADASVSGDLLLRGLIAAGASEREIGHAIARTPSRRPRTGSTRGNAA